MPIRVRVVLLCLAGVLLISPLSQAQNEDSARREPFHPIRPVKPLKNEFTFWGGRSLGSPQVISLMNDQRLFMAGLCYGRLLVTRRNASLWYDAELIPIVILSQPAVSFRLWTNGKGYTAMSYRRYSYGAGISPVGFRGVFGGRRWPLQPYFDPSVGFLSFTRPTPVPNARRFNFAFKFGSGLQLSRHRNRAVRMGFWFQHFSNHGTAHLNPGVDGYIVYVSYSFFK